jgi:hypothetical protein
VTEIAIVERQEDLALPGADVRVVAATAGVVAAAPGLDRVDAHADQAAIEALGERTIEDALEIADAIDGHVRAALGDPLLRPGRWHVFFLKILIDALVVRATVCDRVLADLRPTGLVSVRRDPASSPALLVDPDEGLWDAALAAVAAVRGVPHLRLPPLQAPQPPAPSPPGLRDRAVRTAGRARLLSAGRLRPRRGAGVLLLDLAYGSPDVAAALLRLGRPVWAWAPGEALRPLHRMSPGAPVAASGELDPAALDAAWSAVAADPRVRTPFAAGDVDLWALAAPRLEGLVRRGLPRTAVVQREARAAVRASGARAVLASVAAYPDQKAALEGAAAEGAATVVTRHGEVGLYDNPTVALEDVDTVGWALAWGEREAAWVARASRAGTRPVVTGSPFLEREASRALSRRAGRRRLGVARDEALVLFVPTGFNGNLWHAPGRIPLDTAYLRHLHDVLVSLAALRGCRVALKAPPGEQGRPLIDAIASGPDVQVLRAPPFGRLVHLADAVVIDTPSTAFAQALGGSARIYLSGTAVTRWAPGVAEELEAESIAVTAGAAVARRVAADLAAGLLARPAPPRPRAVAAWLDGTGCPPGAASCAAAAVATLADGRAP